MRIGKRKYFLLRIVSTVALLFALGLLAGGQGPVQIKAARPFEPAEELIYEAEFSRSLLRKLDVADFKFTAYRTAATEQGAKTADPDGAVNSSSDLLKFTGDVSSKGFFSKLFNLHFRERVESTVDADSLAVQQTVRLDQQGKRVRTSEAVFDRATGKVCWIERDPNDPEREPRTASGDFNGQVQDVLSIIYYLRTRPLEIGKHFEVTLSDSGRVYSVPVKVLERKRLKTLLGRVNAIRIQPELFGPQGLLKSKGKLSMWLTDDNKRVPVKAQVKTEYGVFDITLKRVSYPPAQQPQLTGQK